MLILMVMEKKEIHSDTESPTRSPHHFIDSNKPLPPTPKVGAEKDRDPPRPLVKLERIISPLKDADIRKLFAGAPQFFVHYSDDGQPLPRVGFPWYVCEVIFVSYYCWFLRVELRLFRGL